MKNLIHASTVICIVLFIAGCSFSGNEEETHAPTPIDFSTLSQDSTLLVGTWKWKRSTYYFTSSGTPIVQTPRSTGRTETLVFTPDDTVEVYRNGEPAQEMTYRAYLDGQQWGVSATIFVTSTAYVDGPESVYVREE